MGTAILLFGGLRHPICIVLAIVILTVIAVAGFDQSTGQQSQTETAKAERGRARIVPVVMLKPDENKELLLSAACTVGVTRSGGLDIRGIGGKEREGFESSKVWKRDGGVVEVPNAVEGTKEAASPLYEPLKKRGFNAFFREGHGCEGR
jgi:hypothetical protein